MITKIEDPDLKEVITGEILGRLPDWFGIPESTAEYGKGVRDLPFWADLDGEELRGFICLRTTSPCAAEIYVMGVLPAYHRLGIGRDLFRVLEDYARKNGYIYLHVKTVVLGKYPSYDKTNLFYTAMGFRRFDVLPTLWDENNPCQVYIKAL